MIFRLSSLSSRAKPRDPSARSLRSLGRDDNDVVARSAAKRSDEAISSVLVHLKMTGQLIYERRVDHHVNVIAGGHKLVEKDFDLPNKHTQVIINFADKGKLFFNDLRRFGYMKLANEKEANAALLRFGPEPIESSPPALSIAMERGIVFPSLAKEGVGGGFTLAYLNSIIQKHKKINIKALLLNQQLIAGIGNIYADEICWCAKVMPTRKVSSLTTEEKKKIFSCAPKIIKLAIKHRGTTFKDYLDTEGKKGNYTDFLNVYDRDGEKCPRCKNIIKKIKSGGRGTHYCPHCQK